MDRYLIRMNECLESVKIIEQILIYFSNLDYRVFSINKSIYIYYFDIQFMIIYFDLSLITLPKIKNYIRQEAPKGELGIKILIHNSNNVSRLKIRSAD